MYIVLQLKLLLFFFFFNNCWNISVYLGISVFKCHENPSSGNTQLFPLLTKTDERTDRHNDANCPLTHFFFRTGLIIFNEYNSWLNNNFKKSTYTQRRRFIYTLLENTMWKLCVEFTLRLLTSKIGVLFCINEEKI
jgi:hypothetical protein